jgi:hypothetical protein
MKVSPRSCLLWLAAVAFLAVPSFSSAAVRIELKNGQTIVADECRESGRSLQCYKMGGTFAIEKGDIASVKRTSENGTSEEETFPSVRKEPVPAAGGADHGAEPKNPATDTRAKLDRITAQKRALLPQREKLVKERERLQEEVKEAPAWMTVDRFDALKKKISALDEKIKSFNEEVRKLNGEEKAILDAAKKTSAPAEAAK